MIVGVVREVKEAEGRVALTPAGAAELARAGHAVLVEHGAGLGARFADADYERAGATLLGVDEVWEQSELLLKVKEPIEPEFGHLREGLTLFTYLHLAAAPALTEALRGSGTVAIAYETVAGADGTLPLLAPMSEIAGRLATQAGAYFMQAPMGGSGTLIGGAPGVAPARMVVIGGGAVGINAARVGVGMGADVTILDRDLPRVRKLEEYFGPTARVVASDSTTLAEYAGAADLIVGAVLVPGASAPKLIDAELLAAMRAGTVVVDVAIDQGGCSVASRPTTHGDPVFDVDGVLHYCVANMPGAVPATSTRALTNATLPYVLRLAGLGIEEALETDPEIAAGLNVRAGELAHPALV